jgi:predicted transposase YbfD/YdcC
MNTISATLAEHFGGLEDPRVEHLTDHKLLDIIMIALCAIISGAETWKDMALFGQERLEWLRQFMPLENGIPSDDTFGRVFARLKPEQFQACFTSWVKAVFEVTKGQVIAIDGKSARHSYDKANGKEAVHLVSAWATDNHLVLGQQAVDAKSNEITAIPALLRLLDVSGCIVTLDAMGCQTAIAEQIISQDGDYVLAVKDNQANLHQDTALAFRLAQHTNFQKVTYTYDRTVNKDHGRVEVRQCWAISGQDSRSFLRQADRWPGLQTLAMVTNQRQVNGQTTTETRYYITSLPNDAARILRAVRSHWGIENALHWVLDVVMDEDSSRIRKDHAPENMAALKRFALSLLKQEKTLKRGIQGKRLKAAMNPDYLLKVLSV